MKPAFLLLTASLVGNAALLGVVLTASRSSAPVPVAPVAAPARAAGADAGALREALARGDAAALAAAGVSPEVARQIVLGRALSVHGQRLRELVAKQSGGAWWKARGPGTFTAAGREEWTQATREVSEALAAALGVDVLGVGGREAGQLAFLDAAKRSSLRRILQDYDEMTAKFGASGLQLASDREKLKLLQSERERDIAALLTPAERDEFELRTSATSASLRQRLGDAIQSEEDFRTLYALQKAFDEKYPRDALTGRITPEVAKQRAAAERQLAEDMRAALGDEKYAAIRLASDPELRSLDQLVSRVGLPAEVTTRVAAAREAYAAESQRIMADAALTPPERRPRLQELAARARTDLGQILGAEVAEAYAPRASWVSMLQGGVAFTTNPKDTPMGGLSLGGGSVFPILPAGASGARQSITVTSSGGAVAAPSGMIFSPGLPVANEVQVISFSSSSSTTTTAPASPSTPATTPPPR